VLDYEASKDALLAEIAELRAVNDRLRSEIQRGQCAHATLLANNVELQAVCDGMVDGLAIVDPRSTRYLRVNAAMCRLLGYAEEELRELTVRDLHPAEALPQVLTIFQADVARGPSYHEGVACRHKDGSVLYVDIGTVTIVPNGRRCLAAFFRDMTHRVQSEDALRHERRILRHLLVSTDHALQLISYEIHDGLAQQLAAALMWFSSFDHLQRENAGGTRAAFDTAVAMLRSAHRETRRLISGMRPPLLDEAGVVAAVENLVCESQEQGGPKIEWVSRVTFDRLQPELENTIYRIVQESLTNARRHSRSDRVKIELSEEQQRLRLEIRDWGVGFQPGVVAKESFGLQGIRERVKAVGGRVLIQSAPGQGTRIAVELPLAAEE
jgi:PAS domain S-box-containing protein